MTYQGSCHCGRVRFEVEGEVTQVMDCNCSICFRKGALLWFVPREALRLLTPAEDLGTYTFGKHVIKHRFCPTCGIHPFRESADASGTLRASINVRCLESIDLSSLSIQPFDGRKIHQRSRGPAR